MSVGLAIVGASAAGLAAAVSAARAGADVVLLETKEEVGVPPAPASVGFDFLWPDAVPRPPRSVRRRLDGVKVRARDGRVPIVESPLSLFDRTALDAHLAAEAQKAGARIVTGAAAGAWEVLEARVVLFADGARSEARRHMRPTREPSQMAWGAILECEAPGDGGRLLLTLGSHAPGGRSQLNPHGEGRWSHWTFFRGDPAHAERLARRALALDARLQGWGDVTARFVGVAPDPVYTLPRQPLRMRGI
ncbi:MAG TPA: NAD(P)-binding protein, partial [Candidatus Thermoplasmatota archaeon]|nr:NAD(P)-binding protein [Candidatus Thermoplasmatota archaeon]